MRMSSLSSLSRKSLANCLTEYMDARSRCRITTLPFPVDRRMSSAASSALVRSLHAITTRAPWNQSKHASSWLCEHMNVPTTWIKHSLNLTSACQLSGRLFADAAVCSSDQNCLPVQMKWTVTNSTSNIFPQHRYACTHTNRNKVQVQNITGLMP